MKATSSYLELRNAVEELHGIKPVEIAKLIAKRRIQGRPGTTGRCPLALLMQGAHGGKFIVGQKYVMRTSGKSVEKVKTPANLAAFVRMFDAGKFAELIQVPPRCGPVRATDNSDKRGGKVSKKIRHARGAARLHLARDAERFGPRV